MKKVLGIIVLSLCLNSNSYAEIKSNDITFPGKYYTKEIKTCSAIPKDKSFSNQSAIDTLMEIVTGVKLEHDPIYLQKRKMHTPDGIDDLIGFNPNCI